MYLNVFRNSVTLNKKFYRNLSEENLIEVIQKQQII